MQVEEVKKQFANDIINHPRLTLGQKKQALMFLRDYSTKARGGMASCFTVASNYINFCLDETDYSKCNSRKNFIVWKEIKKLILFRGTALSLDEIGVAMRMSERSLKNSLSKAIAKGHLFQDRFTKKYYAK